MMVGLKKSVQQILLVLVVFAVTYGVGYIFRHIGFPDTNIVLIYLLAVLITVWLTKSFMFGFVASVLATFSFNYLFAEPLLAFSVNDPSYIVTFITMMFTALVTSILTSHARKSALSAQEKEAEAKAIYNLTNHLTDAEDIDEIARIAVLSISDSFSCNAACLCIDENGMPEQTFIQQTHGNKQIRRKVPDIQEVKRRIEELETDYDIGEEFFDWPINGREAILGIIRIPKEKAKVMKEAQVRLLRSMIVSTALAMDRFRAAKQRMKSREEIVKERYRANLLRAISHDIRTPLSSIIGTSEMLMNMTKQEDPRYSLAGGIQKDADWLRSMVENILNLTRLQDGKIALNKQKEAVEEVIGEALSRIAKRAPDYEITVHIPDELLLVPMDAKLIEQVIINLLDNAIKHSEQGEEIALKAEINESINMAQFTISDMGSGISDSDFPYIFQTFYTTDIINAKTEHGIGLGLAICETIIKAHGGNIEAHKRIDGQGTEFIFTLPMKEDQDE